jgi:hypothetical protein
MRSVRVKTNEIVPCVNTLTFRCKPAQPKMEAPVALVKNKKSDSFARATFDDSFPIKTATPRARPLEQTRLK